MESFIAKAHKDVMFRLLRLFAIALEIEDEEHFVKLHDYDGTDTSWLRYMKYHGDEYDDGAGGKTVWLQGACADDLQALQLPNITFRA